jgi:glycosyltransferase involved in cell wall biosynthesis
VIANSHATLATLPDRLRVHVLYNPVVPDAVEQPVLQRRRENPVLTVGVLGRLAPWKGQHVFLDAFAEAFRGEAACARVIGSPLFGEDAYAADLVERAERLGITDQVDFRGFREDIWAELNELDILVHCSITPEPFGQVVLEGMAAGLAVVAAGAGGPAEIVRSGVDGLLVQPHDTAALAAALAMLAADPAQRGRLGAAARERSRDFTPERAAVRLAAVYRGLLADRLTPADD